jgi:hypothetical protein
MTRWHVAWHPVANANAQLRSPAQAKAYACRQLGGMKDEAPRRTPSLKIHSQDGPYCPLVGQKCHCQGFGDDQVWSSQILLNCLEVAGVDGGST